MLSPRERRFVTKNPTSQNASPYSYNLRHSREMLSPRLQQVQNIFQSKLGAPQYMSRQYNMKSVEPTPKNKGRTLLAQQNLQDTPKHQRNKSNIVYMENIAMSPKVMNLANFAS